MEYRDAYRGRRVLVTGAAGFIGSHLVEALAAAGARVGGLDDLSAGRLENLGHVRDRIEFFAGSLLEPATLDAAMDNRDVVFHLAANASVPLSAQEPTRDFTANAVGSFRLIDAVRRHGRPQVVFASSAAVYGEPCNGPTDEEHSLRPQSPYGGSKLAAEFTLEAHGRCYDIDVRRVRIFNTYGPRQRRYVMFDLLEKLRRDPTRLEVIGTGDQERDYNYVADTVDALMLVGAHPDAQGGVFNVAGGRPVSIRALVSLLLEELPLARPEISYTRRSWPGDIVRMIGDISRLRELGYTPKHDLREGIRRLISWHRSTFGPPW